MADQLALKDIFATAKFGDPEPFLRQLRLVQIAVVNSALPSKIADLRTNTLKCERELRDAALFTYGMGKRLGQGLRLAPVEHADFDFLTHRELFEHTRRPFLERIGRAPPR